MNLVFYLLLLLLPTQFGKHFWPDFAFVSGLRIDYLSPTIYFTDVLILMLFILWTKEKFLNIKSLKHSLKILASWRSGSNFKFQIVLFAIFLLIGILQSKSPLNGWYGLVKLIECVWLGIFISQTRLLKLNTLSLVFCFGILFESILAIMQFFHQGSIGGLFYFLGERDFNIQTPGIANAALNGELALRPYATFSHPNVLAGYLTIVMIMVISNFQSHRDLRFPISNAKRLLFFVSLVIGTTALLLTMSRVAILLWCIILILNIKNSFKTKNLKLKILFSVFLYAGAVFLFLSPIVSRFTQFNLSEESVVVRRDLLNASVNMFLQHPILGVGLHNFLISLPQYQQYPTLFLSIQPVHNVFVLIAAETGLIGFLSIMWFLSKIMLDLKKKKEFHPGKTGIKFQILLMVLILGFFDHYFLTLQQGQLLLVLVLGLCVRKT